MASSLSNLLNNHFETIHRVKCKFAHNDKKCETCRFKYKCCDCFLEYTNVKDDLIKYKYLCCNKKYQRKFDKRFKERFFNTYKFSNQNNNISILLLQKGVYPYECVHNWEKFNETSLPENKDIYSHLSIEDITDADFAHSKRVYKDFEIKNLGEYHDLYVYSDTLLLAVYLKISEKCVLKYAKIKIRSFSSYRYDFNGRKK